MLRKLVATLSVALVALLFTSPTALATDSDNTNNVTYWQNYYGGGTVCYKDDSSKGTVNGKTVTLKDGGWTHLIVKGGSVDTGAGPGNVTYDNPKAGTAYAAPNNSGGQPADVSHWIVCGPPPFDWNWQYADPTCQALVVVYPADIPAGQANDVNVKIKNLVTGETKTLNFHNNSGTWSGSTTFTFASHANWPSWQYYAVVWTQVGGTNYHWEGNITCGGTPDAKVTYGEWVDSDWACGDETVEQTRTKTVTSYVLVDGKWVKDTENATVTTETSERDLTAEELAECTPPEEEMCLNIGKTIEWAEAHGYYVEEGVCFQKVYVCKYVTTPGGTEVLQTGNNPISVSVNALPAGFNGTFPFEFVDAHERSVAFAYALPGTPQGEEPGVENCDSPPPVQVCIRYELVEIPASQYAGHEDEYVLYDEETCHPPVDVCLNLPGQQTEVPAGWEVSDAGKCFHYEVVCWLMDNYHSSEMPPADHFSTFPQTRVDCDQEIPCGMWVQTDLYYIDDWAKEEVFLNLGDILTWNGGPEDSLIYIAHYFTYGGDCPPPVEYCVWDAETKTAGVATYGAGQVPEGAVPWVDGSECTPPNIDLSLIEPVCDSDAPFLAIDVVLFDPGELSTDDGTVDLKFWDEDGHEYWIHDVALDEFLDAKILWPGAAIEPDGEGGFVATGWPGWEKLDGIWTPVGDNNFGWTREGAKLTVYFNPEKTFDLAYPEPTWACGNPPPVQICVDYEMMEIPAADYAADPEKYQLYDGEGCQPPVDVCPNIDGPQSEIPDGMLLYGEGNSTKCATPPTLAGTLVSSQCIADVPWINYDIVLTDPDDVSTDDGTATFTFSAAGHPGLTHTVVIPLDEDGTTEGRFLWPGASATDNGDGTWTPTGWPGWALVDGEWVSIGDENFGWTRNGVTVDVEVNPDITVSLSYPPPTALCVAGPPTEIDQELDAPPANPVEAEAQYAG